MTYEIGELIEDKGIFMGRMNVFRNQGIKQKFNVFAAPTNFLSQNQDVLMSEFEEAVQTVALLDQFLKNDGFDVSSEEALAKSVMSGEYKGQWVLPTYRVMHHVIAKNKDQGAFKDSYVKGEPISFEGPEYSWILRDGEDMPEIASCFRVDTDVMVTKTLDEEPEASIRPVRFEPA